MHARAGHFAYGIQARHAGGGLEISPNAAHPVVGGRGHWDRLPGGFQPEFTATPQDRGELALQARQSHRPQIQPQMVYV